MVSNSDLSRWQQAINGIVAAQSELTSEELSAFQALTEFINNGHFEASESRGYIQIMKNAPPQHSKNRLLKLHLTNFVTLCEKYFKVQAAVVSSPLSTIQSSAKIAAQAETSTKVTSQAKIFVAPPQVSAADLSQWQQAINSITATQRELATEEQQAFHALVSLLNNGDFESGESGRYIQIIRDALPQHVKNRLLRAHLINFVTLCEKYFKVQVSPTQTMDSKMEQPKKEFYYFDGNDTKGPLGINQLKSIDLKPDTLVWTEGMDDWKPAKEVEDLEILIRKTPSQITTNRDEKTESIPIFGASKKLTRDNKKPTKRKKLKMAIITGGIIGIIAIGIALFFLYAKTNETVGYSLIPVSSNGEKWGYINRKGEYVINLQFDDADFFNDGLAKIKSSEGKTGYINEHGEYVIPAIYKDGTKFCDGLAFVVTEGGFPTCIDKSGNTIFVLDAAEQVSAFSEGLAMFTTEEGVCGFVDKTGKIAIHPQFHGVGHFSEGKASFYDGIQWGYINTKGAYAINPQFDSADRFSEGLAAIRQGGMCGYINKDGKIVVNPQFYHACPFSGGLAAVHKGDMYGYINKDGKYIINQQFEDAGNFYNGIAPVRNTDKWGFINKKGQYVVNPQFNGVKTDTPLFFVQSDYYDASEFIKLFLGRESGDTFDGINASTTLEELSNHPNYGAGVNARSEYYADYNQVIPITKDISIINITFRFDNTPIYKTVDTYSRWGYRSGTKKEFDFSATHDAIVYQFRLNGKAYEKHNVVLNALKTEIERRHGLTMKRMDVEQDFYCLFQDNGKLNFGIGFEGNDVTLIVAFSKEYLENLEKK